MKNRYPGYCRHCGARVEAEEGTAQTDDGGNWRTYCPGVLCQAKASAATAPRLTGDGRLYAPYEMRTACASLPGATWTKAGRFWKVSTALEHRGSLLSLCQKYHIAVDSSLEVLPEEEASVETSLLAAGLRPYQVTGVLWLRSRARALLGDDPGTGKTVQTLLALGKGSRTLVLAPAFLLLNWEDECRKWRPDLRPVVLRGRESTRRPEAGELLITNFDVLPTVPPRSRATYPIDLSDCTLVIDEATYCKNSKAARTRSVRGAVRSAARSWLLTGTPLLGKPADLWGVLYSGRMADEVFGGWGGFVHAFHGKQNHFGGWEFGGPRPEVADKLRRVMLRRRKLDVIPDMPPIVYHSLRCDITDPVLVSKLDALWGGWRSERNLFGEEELPSDLPPFERFSEVRAELAQSRIPRLLELVERYEEADEPLVVFSAHRSPIIALGHREHWRSLVGDTSALERDAAVRAFQSGQLRGIALTYGAGAYGLTLTRGSTLILVDLSWTPSENEQAIARCQRIGTTASSIDVTILVSDHALDQHVVQLLEQKRTLISAAVEGLDTARTTR